MADDGRHPQKAAVAFGFKNIFMLLCVCVCVCARMFLSVYPPIKATVIIK